MSEQRRLWKKVVEPEGPCPTIERLSLLMEDPDRFESSEEASHVTHCPRCRAEMELMREFREARVQPSEEKAVEWMVGRLKNRSEEIFEENTVLPKSTRESRSSAPGTFLSRLFSTSALSTATLIAAGVVVLIAAGLWIRQMSLIEPAEPDPSAIVLRSQVIRQAEPQGELSRAPELFSWQPVKAAAKYEVKVYEVDDSMIWTGATSQTHLVPPPELSQLIIPGKKLFWQVTAYDSGGTRLASSRLTDFRVEVAAPANRN